MIATQLVVSGAIALLATELPLRLVLDRVA